MFPDLSRIDIGRLALRLVAWAVCVVAGLAAVVKATSFVPDEPMLALPLFGEVSLFRALAAPVLATALVAGVALLADVAWSWAKRGGWGILGGGLIYIFWVVLAAGDATLSSSAWLGARAQVEASLELPRLRRERAAFVAELAEVTAELGRDRAEDELLNSKDLLSDDEGVQRAAVKGVQLELGISPTGNWLGTTQARLDERRPALAAEIAAGEARQTELQGKIAAHDDEIAAKARDVLPAWAAVAIAVGGEVFVVVVLAATSGGGEKQRTDGGGEARLPRPPKAAPPDGKKVREAWRYDPTACPGPGWSWIPALPPGVRANAPNGVVGHWRPHRGGGKGAQAAPSLWRRPVGRGRP